MVDIQLKNIAKKYPKATSYSVEDFNINIKDREFIVFVGPSGCGKSTTLRMIAGLEDITGGELVIDGKLMNDVEPKDRDIAMVFQNYALYPHMTVFDNMAFGLQLRKYPKKEIKDKVENAAQILGLTDYLDRKPAALSGGQRQRVALGRAIVRDAKVFLMDEPLSNLDAKLRVKMRAEISRLHNQLETTSIYVTHDQTEAMTLASRIVIMNEGRIQQIGTPEEVYDHPANIFVAGFIGSPGMNFLNLIYNDGELHFKDGTTLKVSEPDKKILDEKGYNNKEVVFGIRPEGLLSEQVALESFPDAVKQYTVNLSEMTGAETILYINEGETEITARLDSRNKFKMGDKIDLVFNMNKAHFFDKDTEEVIN